MPTFRAVQRSGLLALLLAAPLQAQSFDSLRTAALSRIAGSGATVGFYFRNLARAESLVINPDRRFHAASTMKLPIMVQVFRDVDAQRLGLRDPLTIRNEFRSLADSSAYTLSADDDTEKSLYRELGRPVPLLEVIELMITRSSNLAANNLIELVTPARIQNMLQLLGADSLRVMRGVEDGAAFRAGLNNTATARGLGILMGAIASADAATAHSSGEMMQILMRQRERDGIPAGLPRRTRVANKRGDITGVHHDVAVVYYDNRPRYVLVILTEGLQEREAASALMADLARLIHAYAVPESIPRRFVPMRP